MPATAITSAGNKLYKLWHSLNAAKGIERHGLALVSGRRIVPELAARATEEATILITADADANNCPPARARTAVLAAELFAMLDEFGTRAPLLVLPVPHVETFDAASPPRGLEILAAAQDPSNLGAILRSALAFGAARVVLLQECAHAFLPKVTRAASGANFKLVLARGPSIRAVRADAVALDMTGAPIDAFVWPQDCRLLLGEEGAGIPAAFAGRRVAIPIAAQADSLNVAVAAGIALASYRRQHPL